MVRELDALLQLQSATGQAAVFRRELSGVPDSMQEIHDEHEEHAQRIAALEAQIRDDELARRTAEAAISDFQARLDHYQAQVNRVTTQREYGSLLKEIDAAREAITQHEEESLAILERVEASQAELATLQGEFTDLDQRYREQLADWENEKPVVADRLHQLEDEIKEIESSLPRSLLGQFKRLYERNEGDVFATARRIEQSRGGAEWHCSHCNYRVRPQAIVDIKNLGALIPCDSCHRFLRLEENA